MLCLQDLANYGSATNLRFQLNLSPQALTSSKIHAILRSMLAILSAGFLLWAIYMNLKLHGRFD